MENLIFIGAFLVPVLFSAVILIPIIKLLVSSQKSKAKQNQNTIAVITNIKQYPDSTSLPKFLLTYEFTHNGNLFRGQELCKIDLTILDLFRPGCKIPIVYEQENPRNSSYIFSHTFDAALIKQEIEKLNGEKNYSTNN